MRAHFTAIKYTVTVFTTKTDGSALSGVQVTFGAETMTTDTSGKAEFLIPAGSYSLGVQSPIAGGSGIQYAFNQFTNGVTLNPRSVTVGASAAYEAKYTAVGTYWYDSGQTAVIQGSPASGYVFSLWAGIGSGSHMGTANPASVIMKRPVTATATLASAPIVTGSSLCLGQSRSCGPSSYGELLRHGQEYWQHRSNARLTIKIYRPDGTLVATPEVTVKGIQPGGQYIYRISWRVPYNAPRGIWHYEVCVNYAGVLIDSSTNPANTITVG